MSTTKFYLGIHHINQFLFFIPLKRHLFLLIISTFPPTPPSRPLTTERSVSFAPIECCADYSNSFAKVIVTRTQSDRTANATQSGGGRNLIGRRTQSDRAADANGDDHGCEQEDDKSLRNDVIHHFVRC